MYLTSITKIKRNHVAYAAIDAVCLNAKKLRNKVIWLQREEFKSTGGYIQYKSMVKVLAKMNDPDYRRLPSVASQEVCRSVDESYKSFFALKKKDLKTRPPRFSPSGEKGRSVATYNYVGISKKSFKKGFIKPRAMSHEFPLPIHLKGLSFEQIKEVRFVPKGTSYQMEIVYTTQEVEYKDTGNYLAIDLGMRNFLTMVGNNSKPTIIKERNNKIRNDINCLTNQLINYIQGLNVSDVYIGW